MRAATLRAWLQGLNDRPAIAVSVVVVLGVWAGIVIDRVIDYESRNSIPSSASRT